MERSISLAAIRRHWVERGREGFSSASDVIFGRVSDGQRFLDLRDFVCVRFRGFAPASGRECEILHHPTKPHQKPESLPALAIPQKESKKLRFLEKKLAPRALAFCFSWFRRMLGKEDSSSGLHAKYHSLNMIFALGESNSLSRWLRRTGGKGCVLPAFLSSFDLKFGMTKY